MVECVPSRKRRLQSFKLVQASQLMGLSAWKSFFKVSLVLSRGAIVAALALISMETMADFATVSYFAVSTLTTAVYDTWFGYYSLTAAAKISGVMLLLLFLALITERFIRNDGLCCICRISILQLLLLTVLNWPSSTHSSLINSF